MHGDPSFGEVLEAVDKLSLDDQETLIDVVQRRLKERRREELAREADEAYREFQAGKCRPATVEEIMREIRS